jgi:cytochrome c
MLKFLPSPDILLLLILSISILSACEREQSTSAPPSALETPAVEPQQAPADTAQPSAAPEITPQQQATASATTTAPTEDAAPAAAESTETKPSAGSVSVVAEDTSPNAESMTLARKSGCLACHAIDKKVVGPAWQDVATRYANNADARTQLIEKVSKGGKGNWTDVVGTAAMPPYYPRVSKENIEKLVDFVLSLAEK